MMKLKIPFVGMTQEEFRSRQAQILDWTIRTYYKNKKDYKDLKAKHVENALKNGHGKEEL